MDRGINGGAPAPFMPRKPLDRGVNLFTVAIDKALNRDPQVPVKFTKDPLVFRVVYRIKMGC